MRTLAYFKGGWIKQLFEVFLTTDYSRNLILRISILRFNQDFTKKFGAKDCRNKQNIYQVFIFIHKSHIFVQNGTRKGQKEASMMTFWLMPPSL